MLAEIQVDWVSKGHSYVSKKFKPSFEEGQTPAEWLRSLLSDPGPLTITQAENIISIPQSILEESLVYLTLFNDDGTPFVTS